MRINKTILKKSVLHIFLWSVMLFYFTFSHQLIVRFFIKNGKPVQVNVPIPSESERIEFVVEGLLPYRKDGENLYQLYGWAFLLPEEDPSSNAFARELALVADERNYVFPMKPEFRNPDLPGKLTGLNIDLNSLGFSTLIAEDILKPGKYRISVIFRNTSNGSALYWDKPVHYLVKTPNTLRLEGKK